MSYAASGVLRAVLGRPPFLQGSYMKTIVTIAAAAGLIALGACSQSATENKADNIEANAESVADNYEAMGENASDAVQANAENAAEATRNAGENAADAVRNSDDH